MNELAERREPQAVTQAPTPAHMLQAALEKGLDPQQLGQFMDLYERWETEQARKQYSAAMVAAQAEMPAIAARSWNNQTSSHYAKLDKIVKEITPVFTRHGIALTFSEGESPKEGHIRVLCDVTHESGHTVQRHIDMPIVTTGIRGNQMMTPTHATGSAFSYGRRYLTLMIGNLATGDDDDGNGPSQSPVASKMEPTADDSLMADLEAKADEGWEALQKTWASLTEQQRVSVGSAFGQLKKRAQNAGR